VEIGVANLRTDGLNSGCGVDHGPTRLKVDIAPLMKLIWSPAATKCEIKFARHIVLPSNGQLREADVHLVFPIDPMNAVLKHLSQASLDFLKLHYGQLVSADISTRWNSFLALACYQYDDDRFLSLGTAELGVNGRDHQADILYDLAITADMTTFRVQKEYGPEPQLLGMPNHIRRRIWEEVLVQKQGITIDSLTGEKSGVDIGLLNIDRYGEDTHPQDIFWIENAFNLRLHSSEATTSFGQLEALARVLCREDEIYTSHRPWAVCSRGPQHGPVRVELLIENDELATLSCARIDITHLLRAISSYRGKTVDFRLVLAPRRANGVPLEQCTVPLGVLQIKALAALTPVVEKYPALMEAEDFAIYVDGRGDVKVVQTEAWGEQHTFSDKAFEPVSHLAHIVAQFGIVPKGWQGPDAQYNGTLWYWVRYLEEVVAVPDDWYPSEISVCNKKYFSTATDSFLGWQQASLLRKPSSFERPGPQHLAAAEKLEQRIFLT
jgi:hypothetical protein